jgi:hypothetical protein
MTRKIFVALIASAALAALPATALAQRSRSGSGGSSGGQAQTRSGSGGGSGGQATSPPPSTPPPSSGGHAVPRGQGSNGGNAGNGAQTRGRDSSSNDGRGAAARAGAGQNSRGHAVERQPGSGGTTIIVPSPGYGGYYPWAWGGLGFGGYYSGFYDPWGYGGYDGPVTGGYPYDDAYEGALRLKVKPRDASVYVDGYFAGRVDDFDGVFQKLTIDSGPHRIEVRQDGFEPLTFEVRIQPDRTVTYTGELQKLP